MQMKGKQTAVSDAPVLPAHKHNVPFSLSTLVLDILKKRVSAEKITVSILHRWPHEIMLVQCNRPVSPTTAIYFY